MFLRSESLSNGWDLGIGVDNSSFQIAGYWPVLMLQLKILVIGSAIYAANSLNIFAGISPTRQDFFDFIDDIFFHTCASLNWGMSLLENNGILMSSLWSGLKLLGIAEKSSAMSSHCSWSVRWLIYSTINFSGLLSYEAILLTALYHCFGFFSLRSETIFL